MIASLVQVLGGCSLTAGAYVAWGLAPGLGAAGALLVAFGVAAELKPRKADG